MKSLPGSAPRRWLVFAGQLLSALVVVALTLSVLPLLLLMSLVTALALIPVLRQVRKEAERSGIGVDAPARDQLVDVTPLHRRLERTFWLFWQRRR
jgi:hypothetical protein